jgi:hypothetical protein
LQGESGKDANNRLLVDQFWTNDYYWGNLQCVDAKVHTVAAGGSIQSAVDASAEGDIVKVSAGNYEENVIVSSPYVTIMADGEVTISPKSKGDAVFTLGEDDAYGVTIEGFTFEGLYQDETNTDVYAQSGVSTGSALTKVLGNTFKHFQSPVLESTSDVERYGFACVYEDNVLEENKGGLKFNSPFSIARYNTFKGQTSGYGLDVKGLPANNCIDLAFNSILDHQGECGIGYGGEGVFTIHHNNLNRGYELYSVLDNSGDDGIENQESSASVSYIYNNTIVGWKSDGIQFGPSNGGSSAYYVRNNLVAYNGAKDYDVRSIDTLDIDNGLSYNNGLQNGKHIGDAPSSYDSVAFKYNALVYFTENPLFTDELNDDYSITSSSPAVDKGEAIPFSFKTMYYGEAPDLGANESGAPAETYPIGVEDEPNSPITFSLSQNYPNPFNPSTTIKFTIPKSGFVTLKVFNILGQEVARLADGELTAGNHEVKFDASRLSSGVYIYKLQANDFSSSKKMMLIK